MKQILMDHCTKSAGAHKDAAAAHHELARAYEAKADAGDESAKAEAASFHDQHKRLAKAHAAQAANYLELHKALKADDGTVDISHQGLTAASIAQELAKLFGDRVRLDGVHGALADVPRAVPRFGAREVELPEAVPEVEEILGKVNG